MFRLEDAQLLSAEEEGRLSEDNGIPMDSLQRRPVELHHIFRPSVTALTTIEI